MYGGDVAIFIQSQHKADVILLFQLIWEFLGLITKKSQRGQFPAMYSIYLYIKSFGFYTPQIG